MESRLLYSRKDVLVANLLRFLCMFHNVYSVFKKGSVFPQCQVNYRYVMLAVLLVHVQVNLFFCFLVVASSTSLSLIIVLFVSFLGFFIMMPVDYVAHRVVQFSSSVYQNINYSPLQDSLENENVRLVLSKDSNQQSTISLLFIVHLMLLLSNVYSVSRCTGALAGMTIGTGILSLLFDYAALRFFCIPIIAAVSYLDLIYDPEDLQWMLNHFKQYGYPLKYESVPLEMEFDDLESQQDGNREDETDSLRNRAAEEEWAKEVSKKIEEEQKAEHNAQYIDIDGIDIDNNTSVHMSKKSKFMSSRKRNGRSNYAEDNNSNQEKSLGSFQQSHIGRTKSLKDTNRIKVLSSNK